MQAADGEVARLQQSAEGLKQERQKGLIEMRKATQQWAVAQADLRSTRHQLKVLQAQVCLLLLLVLLLLLLLHLVLLLLLFLLVLGVVFLPPRLLLPLFLWLMLSMLLFSRLQ